MKKILISSLLVMSSSILLASPNEFARKRSLMDSLAGGSSHINGPNCWNTALYINGLTPGLRFTEPKEWLNKLKDHCEEVRVPQYGDIGRLFHLEDGEIHGFIHIDDTTVFAKHGENSRDGHQYMSYEEMLKQYGKSKECRMNNEDTYECFNIMKFYRCEPQESLQRKNVILNTFDLKLQELLFSSETDWRKSKTCTGTTFSKRVELIQEMKGLVEKMIESGIEISAEVSKAYSEQVYNIEVNTRLFKCSDRDLKYRDIKSLKYLIKKIPIRLGE